MLTEIKLQKNDVLILNFTNPNISLETLNNIGDKIKEATGVEAIILSGKDAIAVTKITAA